MTGGTAALIVITVITVLTIVAVAAVYAARKRRADQTDSQEQSRVETPHKNKQASSQPTQSNSKTVHRVNSVSGSKTSQHGNDTGFKKGTPSKSAQSAAKVLRHNSEPSSKTTNNVNNTDSVNLVKKRAKSNPKHAASKTSTKRSISESKRTSWAS